MKSLQNQYNLIKEGKGNKETFLKEAKTLFPNVVTNVLTYDQAIHNLTERGIISEGFIGVSSQRAIEPNWFKVFNENVDVKATLKQTDKSVEEKETAGYDYKEKKNNNNISTAEILTGYYAEMKNPKNADKTETEIKAVVFKNLEKDPLHYVKSGQFGLEGVGYTEEAPGLGKPKEAKGKYKSSGYGDLREGLETRNYNEWKKELYNIIKKDNPGYTDSDIAVDDEELTKYFKDGKSAKEVYYNIWLQDAGNYANIGEGMYGDSDGDFDAQEEDKQMAYYYYDKGLEAYSEGDYLKADKYRTTALRYGSYVGWGDQDLPPYDSSETPTTNKINEEDVKKKLMPNKQKGIADSMEVKSTLEKVANQIWTERDVNKAKEIFKKHIEESGMNDASKKQMLYTLSTITTKPKLDYYLANALLKYEKLSVKEGMVNELNLSIPRRLKDLIQDATEDSKNGYVQHIEYAGPGIYRISDWFDSDNTIYSVEGGQVLLDRTNEIDIEGNWEGAMDEAKHGKTLTEAKKRAIEKHLKEIEKLGEIAAVDHKIQKIQEKIDELKSKISMTENDGFAEMVDKTAVKDLKKDIALLEKRKKMSEAQKAKLAKKVSGQGKPQTHAGGGVMTGMSESKEENGMFLDAVFDTLNDKMRANELSNQEFNNAVKYLDKHGRRLSQTSDEPGDVAELIIRKVTGMMESKEEEEGKKHIQNFNEHQENLNISDVRSSLKKDDIVLYDGDRYIIIDRIDDDIILRPLRNPYGGSYHSSPMSYPTFKTNINDIKLSFFGGHETGMMESKEEEEGKKAQDMARNAMKRSIGLSGKPKSWEDTVKDVLATRNVKK